MADIPVIVGTNRTEMTLQMAGDDAAFKLDEAGLQARAQEMLGDKARRADRGVSQVRARQRRRPSCSS